MNTIVPPNESARIEALNRYEILDTPAEPQFDRITRLASDICEAPIALISLVDSERQWFKSSFGLDVAETPRDTGFCAHAILKDSLFIVPDTTTDERFSDNPLVLGSPNIRTYIGAPLVTKEGYRLGTLGVFYSEVTTIREVWKERISALAAIVVDELELRVAQTDSEIAVSVAEESEARFRDIAQAAGEWIWETDGNHRYIYHSDNGAGRIFRSSQLMGRTRWELPDVDSQLAQFDDHRETLERHQPFRNFEYYFIDQRGKRQYRRVNGNPVFSKDSSFRGYRGTTTDITELVETFENLQAATAAAEQENISKSAFLANMSHELRTPLNAIIGFSDMMLRAVPGAFTRPEYVEYTSDIKSSGEDLLKTVNDILDLSRVAAGHAGMNDGPVNIPTVIQTCVQRLAFQAEAAKLSIATLYEDDLPLLLADEIKLKQILINLLSNAIKFTPSGGMISISADFSTESGHIIKVSDTGAGLASEDVGKVLLPFQQVDSSLSRKYDGTGLGLPLAASFAEMHGGSLKIVSEADVGTTVEIRFPLERAIHSGSQSMDAALSLDEAMRLISPEESVRSCVITNPRLPDNPIVYVTPEFEIQTGYPQAEVIGRNCRFLQGSNSDPETVVTIREAIENFLPVSADIINYRKDGSPFRNHVSIRPMLDINGTTTSFVAVQSITDLNDLEMDELNGNGNPVSEDRVDTNR